MIRISLVALFCLASSNLFAETNRPWTGQRAETLPESRLEFGVFAKARYGLAKNLELSTHPLLFFIAPNLGAKISWQQQGAWHISTRHDVIVPTLLLRLIAREGSGGVLPVTSKIPWMAQIDNAVVATAQVPGTPHFVTISSGFAATPRLSEFDAPTIDLEFIYPRTFSYYSPISTYGSLGVEGALGGPFHYSVLGRGFFATQLQGAVSFEQTLRIIWRPSRAFQLVGGVVTTLTHFPNGFSTRIIPLLDAHFAF